MFLCFKSWRQQEVDYDQGASELIIQILPLLANDRFITIGKFEHLVEGTSHGMYTETLHTCDLQSGKLLTNSELFQSGTQQQVLHRLYEVMAVDSLYTLGAEKPVKPSDVEGMIAAWQGADGLLTGTEWEDPKVNFTLPDGALTPEGVVFSFQPYEIDCFAAGAYHFVVPYARLSPYLSDTAKRLLGGL